VELLDEDEQQTMKVKFALDKKSIQEFFLRHTEKIIFGIVVVVLLLMAYAAIDRPVYSRTPQDLLSLANQAQQNVMRTPGQVDLRVVDYAKIADNVRRHIDETAYPMPTDPSPPVFPPRGKRGEPQTYPVEKLAASAGFGAFSASAGAAIGGQGNRGYRWALVTGLVPIAQQTEAYYECFRNAFPPEKNPPKYAYYEVQRAEVTDQTTDLGSLKWDSLDLDKADAIPKEWAAPVPEMVAKKYLDADQPALVFPLGPLVNRTWDASVAHPPEIPLSGNTEGSIMPAPSANVPTQPPAEEVHEGPIHHRPHAGGHTEETPSPAKTEQAAQPEEIKYVLFRFFDFTVQPNKRYRYRVQLYLDNPNYHQETRWLQEASLATKEYLATRWSEPSSMIAVPRDDRLLLVEIKPTRGSMDPSGRFALLHWNADQGALVWNEKWALRGQLMNFAKEEARAVATPAGTVPGGVTPPLPADDLLGLTPPGPGPAAKSGGKPNTKPGGKPTGPQADFLTDLLLIDMHGGERQPGRDRAAKEPGEALFLDIDGSMVIHNEVADEAEWQRTATVTPVEKPVHKPPKTHGKPGAAGGADLGNGETPPPVTPTPRIRPRRHM
jgi:hypothetical protein